MATKTKIIAVTGASGLIGSAVAARLRGTGQRVITIGRREEDDLRCDFTNPTTVSSLDLGGVDSIVHCAGVVDEDFAVDSKNAFHHATRGTEALAQRATECGVETLISFSTAHVYGPLCGNVSEETPADPRSDYAIAHFAAEQILKRVAFGGGVRTVVLRPCAVYGIPRRVESFHRWWLAPYSFPLSSVYDGNIVLKSRGTQRRNFVAADDVADTVLATLYDPAPEPWRVINPVGPDSMSILEFARLCAEESEKITGCACAVHSDETAKPESGDDFEFRTVHAFARGQRRIQEYVSEFVKWIVAERAAGRCYEH